MLLARAMRRSFVRCHYWHTIRLHRDLRLGARLTAVVAPRASTVTVRALGVCRESVPRFSASPSPAALIVMRVRILTVSSV
jgi:hypothetical protein